MGFGCRHKPENNFWKSILILSRCLSPGFLAILMCLGGWATLPVIAQDYEVQMDTHTLKNTGVSTKAADLLRFFQQRTLSEKDTQEIENLVALLGSSSFQKRTKASQSLILRGQAALPFLKKATTTGTLEVRERARQCIEKIERVSGPEVEAAAARMLAHHNPKGTLEVLLNYYSFAADEWVKDEVLASLGKAGIQKGKVDPFLLTALQSQKTDQRAAVAFLLGQRGGLAHRDTLRKLLVDPHPQVREMALRGLLGEFVLHNAKETVSTDEALLRNHNIPLNQAGIIQFL